MRRGAALTPAARSYGTGSGQQSVTGYPDGDDSNSLWVVRPALGEPHLPQGTRVSKGTRVRLQHLETRRWLHSHSHLSPLSGRVARAQQRLIRTPCSRGVLRLSDRRQQEVSAFGDDNQSNTNDNWRCVLLRRAALCRQHGERRLTTLFCGVRSVDCEGQYWEKDEKVVFTHVDTGVVLYSHAKPFPRYGAASVHKSAIAHLLDFLSAPGPLPGSMKCVVALGGPRTLSGLRQKAYTIRQTTLAAEGATRASCEY